MANKQKVLQVLGDNFFDPIILICL